MLTLQYSLCNAHFATLRRLTTSWRSGRREAPGQAGGRASAPGSSPPSPGQLRWSSSRWPFQIFQLKFILWTSLRSCNATAQLRQTSKFLWKQAQAGLKQLAFQQRWQKVFAIIFTSDCYTISVQGDRHWNIISLSKPVMASWVKITVKAVYGTVNNGFKEIQIFGCWDWFVKFPLKANRFSNQLILDYFNKSLVCIQIISAPPQLLQHITLIFGLSVLWFFASFW